MTAPFAAKPVSLLAALAAAAVLLAPPLAARAQGEAASGGAGVARISVVQGQVAVQRGDTTDPVAAAVNAPVLGADYVTTGAGSRAEVQLDDASALRLGANVQLRFARLDDGDREVQLAEGTVELRVLRATGARAQIDTPSIAVRSRGSGSYRVTVDANGTTQVTVRAGSADVVTPSGADVLAVGTTLVARGPASSPVVERSAAIADDDFDRFNAELDAPELAALADANAPPGVAGIGDLEAAGSWVSDAGYGAVWTPASVPAGWAPYRDGRWAWEDRYGWTFIGSERWGWAPYHYGRWYHSPRHGWCWYPARAAVAWSPALVTFVTFGGGGGAGFDAIGWVPLAPFEPFSPWWGRTARADDALERTAYKNVRHGGGTEVSRQSFLAGRFDRPRTIALDQARGWRVVRGAVPVVPGEANLRYAADPPARPLAVRTAAFASASAFAGGALVPHRTPFAQQRAALAAPADPWSRFTASRSSPPGHPVTVIDGTATNAPGVTTTTASGTTTTTATSAAHATATVMRANASTARTVQYAAPQQRAAPPPQQYVAPQQQQYVAPPPQRSNPPPQAQHAERGSSSHH